MLNASYFLLAKKYKKVTGKEIYSDTLESTPMLEKEKFPQDYFPEVSMNKWQFQRTSSFIMILLLQMMQLEAYANYGAKILLRY